MLPKNVWLKIFSIFSFTSYHYTLPDTDIWLDPRISTRCGLNRLACFICTGGARALSYSFSRHRPLTFDLTNTLLNNTHARKALSGRRCFIRLAPTPHLPTNLSSLPMFCDLWRCYRLTSYFDVIYIFVPFEILYGCALLPFWPGHSGRTVCIVLLHSAFYGLSHWSLLLLGLDLCDCFY